MTQFLLVQSCSPAMDFSAHWYRPIDRDGDFGAAIAEHFPNTTEKVWRIAPEEGEIDSIVSEAREAFFLGTSLEETRLWRLIHGLVSSGKRFVFFWSMDFRELISPETEAELWELLTEQLSVEGANWELYELWRGKA